MTKDCAASYKGKHGIMKSKPQIKAAREATGNRRQISRWRVQVPRAEKGALYLCTSGLVRACSQRTGCSAAQAPAAELQILNLETHDAAHVATLRVGRGAPGCLARPCTFELDLATSSARG